MHFATLSKGLALACALKAAAVAIPQDVDSAVASITTTNGVTSDPNADLVAVYDDAVSQAAAPVSAPIGAGEDTIPQDVNDAASTAADIANTNTTEASSVSKRAACDPEPASTYSSTSNSFSVSDWVNSAEFSTAANNAKATYAKYNLVPGWRNLKASALANVYMGYTTVGMSKYDPYTCAVKCDQINGCTSFVIYFERDPAFTPGAACPNPAALTRLKCAFYGIPLSTAVANNNFQQNWQFVTRMAGSNAYSNEPYAPQDFTQTASLGNNTILAPTSDNTYLGVQTFANTVFDPQACAAACKRKTELAATNSNLLPCNFFVAYMTYKNNANPLLSCNYYSRPYGSSYAGNSDFTTANGDKYTKTNSYAYTLTSLQSTPA